MAQYGVIEIGLVNNNGGGFNGRTNVREGMTVEQLFAEKNPGSKPTDFKIKVNGVVPDSTYVLQERDRVMIVPNNVKAAQ